VITGLVVLVFTSDIKFYQCNDERNLYKKSFCYLFIVLDIGTNPTRGISGNTKIKWCAIVLLEKNFFGVGGALYYNDVDKMFQYSPGEFSS